MKREEWRYRHPTSVGDDTFRNVGFILPCKSGVVWENQSGGTLCAHPEKEGVWIPLSGTSEPHSPGLDPFWERADCGYKLDEVAEFLKAFGLDDLFAPLEALPAGEEHHEAWVPVAVKTQIIPAAPVGTLVIITYTNSD